MVRKYHNHKLQPNSWHREEEPHNNHEALGKQTKQSNQISLPNLSLSSPLFYSPTSLLSTRSPIYSLLSLSVSLYSLFFVVLYSLFSLSPSTLSLSLSTSCSTLSPSLRLSLLCPSLSLYSVSLLSLSLSTLFSTRTPLYILYT